MRYAYLLLVVALLFNLAAVVCPPTDTPSPPDTSTPVPPTDEWTPTSPPEFTDTPVGEPTPTVGVSPDPSPTETAIPGTPDREKHKPTPETTLPVTGGGLPPNVAIGLTAIGGVVCVFLIVMARAGRRARDDTR